MEKGFETVEERVRNAVTPMYNVACFFNSIQDFPDEEILNFMRNNNLAKVMFEKCDYLIEVAKVVDKHLPEDFSINNIIQK